MPKHVAHASADQQTASPVEVRERILATASDLFYRKGVRAVGVDLVVEEAGVAKTSLYRHFRTKDDLIAAFLRREDEEFWAGWDGVSAAHDTDALAELEAQLEWIGQRVGRQNYRGCPQINVAAEFPDTDHPARAVAIAHKKELRRRLTGIAHRLDAKHPDDLALKLSLMINGAFVSAQVFSEGEATPALLTMSRALIAADGRRET
jgi:AcrR family transcriptional regulator